MENVIVWLVVTLVGSFGGSNAELANANSRRTTMDRAWKQQSHQVGTARFSCGLSAHTRYSM
jgi:hypothetical protein